MKDNDDRELLIRHEGGVVLPPRKICPTCGQPEGFPDPLGDAIKRRFLEAQGARAHAHTLHSEPPAVGNWGWPFLAMCFIPALVALIMVAVIA